MDATVSKSQFKSQALALLRQVEETGEALVITDRGTPALVIQAYREPTVDAVAALERSELRNNQPFVPAQTDMGAWLEKFYAETDPFPDDFLVDRNDLPPQTRDWA